MTPDELLAGYLESGAFDEDALGRLTPSEQAQVRHERDAMDGLRASLDEDDFWAEPDPDLEDRVLAAIFADAAETTATAADPNPEVTTGAATAPVAASPAAARPGGPTLAATTTTATAGAEPAGTVVSLAEARARRSRMVSIGASLVAAAAVVVAVLAFATRPVSTPTDIAAPTTSGAPTTTTPPGLDLVVTGTDLAPGSKGTLRLEETNSGVRVQLDMAGLARRDNGQFYQAWVKTDQGLVPIGTFHTGTDVTLWSGIEIKDMTAITVTLEENDGNQESSGRRVIVAPLRPSTPGSTLPGSTAPGSTAPGSSAPVPTR